MIISNLLSTPRMSGSLSENEIFQKVGNAIHAKDAVCYIFTDQKISAYISNTDMKTAYSQPMPLMVRSFNMVADHVSDFVSYKGFSNQTPINKKTRYVVKVSAYIRKDFYMNIMLYMAKYNVSFFLMFLSITRNYRVTNVSRGENSPVRTIQKLYPHFMVKGNLKDSNIVATAGEFITTQLTINVQDIFFEGDDELNIAIGQT